MFVRSVCTFGDAFSLPGAGCERWPPLDASETTIFLLVLLGRLIIPLFIFRFPLPAIVAAMVLDAVDQTIFQVFTDMELVWYQSYDKALDVYYLAIAYIATMRNWSNLSGFNVGQLLWYYRLFGVTLFELLGFRILLFIFPNTFEYFFIWYETARARWNPLKFAAKTFVVAAAVIWIVIKLPQEYWIHIAQMDVTDFFKESILGASLEDSWGTAIGDALWIIPLMLVVVAGAAVLLRWINSRLPSPDWPLTFDADQYADEFVHATTKPRQHRHWREGLIEKIVLVGLIGIIFGKVLPNVVASTLQLWVGIAVVVAANAFISHWLAVRGTQWRSVVTEFLALGAINVALTWGYILLLPTLDGSVRGRDPLFFIFLLTLIITLYDRYRPIHELREQTHKAEASSS